MLCALVDGPLSKAQLSQYLGHKDISGQLNKVIRLLMADQAVAYTIPDKPNSRLQQYRLTTNGTALLASLKKGDSDE